MSKESLKLVSEKIVHQLHSEIDPNLDLYMSKGFVDMSKENGWGIETKEVKFDPSFAKKLDPSNAPAVEIDNSLLVFNSLEGMTPALAREERIWVRLCHVECLEFARGRWIGTKDPKRDISLHFFARTLDQCRDDNALGRLWWNGFLANLIDPHAPRAVLEQVLARANIRLQFVDRANASFRIPLAQGIVRLLKEEPWLHSHDRAFEHFMLAMDQNGGGRLFEMIDTKEVDAFLKANLPLAKAIHAARIAA